jgi:hypothetical protein
MAKNAADLQSIAEKLNESFAAPLNPTATLEALRVARDALANAIAWLDAMHVTSSRAERRRMYAAAHARVNVEMLRVASHATVPA